MSCLKDYLLLFAGIFSFRGFLLGFWQPVAA